MSLNSLSRSSFVSTTRLQLPWQLWQAWRGVASSWSQSFWRLRFRHAFVTIVHVTMLPLSRIHDNRPLRVKLVEKWKGFQTINWYLKLIVRLLTQPYVLSWCNFKIADTLQWTRLNPDYLHSIKVQRCDTNLDLCMRAYTHAGRHVCSPESAVMGEFQNYNGFIRCVKVSHDIYYLDVLYRCVRIDCAALQDWLYCIYSGLTLLYILYYCPTFHYASVGGAPEAYVSLFVYVCVCVCVCCVCVCHSICYQHSALLAIN